MTYDFIPPQRPQWGELAAVLAPKQGLQEKVSLTIKPGSAIVGCRIPGEPGRLLVYYEGNHHGASNMQTLQDRALHAYGRLTRSYPTIAMAAMPEDHFEVVGEISTNQHFEIDRSNPALLAWVSSDPKLLDAPRRGWTPTGG